MHLHLQKLSDLRHKHHENAKCLDPNSSRQPRPKFCNRTQKCAKVSIKHLQSSRGSVWKSPSFRTTNIFHHTGEQECLCVMFRIRRHHCYLIREKHRNTTARIKERRAKKNNGAPAQPYSEEEKRIDSSLSEEDLVLFVLSK